MVAQPGAPAPPSATFVFGAVLCGGAQELAVDELGVVAGLAIISREQLAIERLLKAAVPGPDRVHEMHRDQRFGRGARRHLRGVADDDRKHPHAVADALDLVVAQLDVLGIDALHVEGRELRVVVQDHDAADIVEAAIVLLDPGSETDELLLVEVLGDRDDAARPRAMRVQHRMRLLGRERKPKWLLQQLHRIETAEAIP